MGVFETKNAGDSWAKRMDGMKEVLMVVTLGLDPTRPSILYAGTSGGVYKSIDQAGHWEKVNNGLVSPTIIKSSRALNVTAVLVDPYEPETVYAATLEGLYKTTDGAASWVRIGQSLQDQMLFSMVLDRTRKGVIYLGGREGIHRSEDGGNTWTTLNKGLATLTSAPSRRAPPIRNCFILGRMGADCIAARMQARRGSRCRLWFPHNLAERRAVGGAPYASGRLFGFAWLSQPKSPRTRSQRSNLGGSIRPRKVPSSSRPKSRRCLSPRWTVGAMSPRTRTLSLLSVDSPMEEPALPVAPMANPARPLPPMSELFLEDIPISWPVSPSTPIAVPVFGVFPMFGPSAGAMPILHPVLALAGSLGARMSLSIDSSISRIARASRPASSNSAWSRGVGDVADLFKSGAQGPEIGSGLRNRRIISWSMIPREAME